MAITDVDKLWPFNGQPTYSADSGDTVIAATPGTVTATFATVGPSAGAVQPAVNVVLIDLAIYTVNALAVLGQIDITVSDGTRTENVASIPAAVAAVAGRGGEYQVGFFLSGLSTVTNIVSVTATIATTVNNNYHARLYVSGGP